MPIYTIVLSPGRTGTAWLTHVLAADRNVASSHEAPGDNARCLDAIASRRSIARDAKIIADRMILAGRYKAAVVEVNGFLRYHAAPIRQHIPTLRIFYLARDGRKVVNSIHNKNLSRVSVPVINAVGKGGRSAFHRTCLYWARTSLFLRNLADETWRFEDLLSSHEVFSAAATKCGAVIPETFWRRLREKKINGGRRESEPWTRTERRLFETIARPEMEALGYREA